MTEQEAIQKSIAHWERMVKWADDREPGTCKFSTMHDLLGEIPTSGYCSLCKFDSSNDCNMCPLFREYGYCDWVGESYYEACHSQSWTGFVKHGKRLIEQLKSLVAS